jgi:CRP/FNR family transcriptional regulator, cyclic AMP receptor protein
MRRNRDLYLDHLAQVPMFRACSRRELSAIARRAEDLTYLAGQVVVKEGTLGGEFFVIASGQARVSRNGKKVTDLGVGSYFGELGLLAQVPRDATVTALADLEVICISRRDFAAVLEEVPSVNRKLLTGMALRLHELDRGTK